MWNQITAHLKNGKSIRSLGDAIQIGAAELILRTTVARQFTDGQHPFDYCNTANYWLRRTESPYQPRLLYLMANFVNDSARSNKLFRSAGRRGAGGLRRRGRSPRPCSPSSTKRSWPSTPRAPRPSPPPISTREPIRRAYLSTVALAACKFQDDPHNQKICHSAFEEYAENSTHLRDRLLLAAARLLAGWTKMPGERECYARFTREWMK